MNTVVVAVILGLLTAGCSTDFWGGGATGAGAAGAGYELRARQQMQKLEEDYKAGRINQHDYEIRKDQIQEGSIFY